MSAAEDLDSSRPPPSRQKNIRLFTPGIPWYRDLRVLRVIAQIIFAIGFIGALVVLINNLTRNLRQSNLTIDFNTYESPFTVAIPEGISANAVWEWTRNTDIIWDGTRLLWFFLFFLVGFLIARRYRTNRIRFGPSATGALFGLTGLFMPFQHDLLPGNLWDVLGHYIGLDSPVIGIVLWLALLAATAYLLLTVTRGNERKLAWLFGAAGLFAVAIIFNPANVGDWLESTFLAEAVEESAFVPDVLVTVVAVAIWLVPVVAALSLVLRMYFYEIIELDFAVMIGLLVFLIAYMHPVERAFAANYDVIGDYLAADGRSGTVTRAFITGIFNTLRVVIASLVACTILGVVVGIGLLSNNWLVRNVSKVYVEIFRNTPLLIQLLFVYRTLTLVLPSPTSSIASPRSIGPLEFDGNLYFLNARGFWYPGIGTTDSFTYLLVLVLIGLITAFFIRRWRVRLQDETGTPAYVIRYTVPVIFGSIVLGWILAVVVGDGPLTVQLPTLPEGARNIVGGAELSIAFVALFLGLTLYTSAFIAEIVRAGIQAVPYGQIEAARAQGLSGSQVLTLVVLPQALRLIIPPLGNQYVNLGKNSSLGLAVTYVETFRIAQLANNEKGQAVAYFVALMLIYLALSLILSVLTNMVNRATQVRTR